ncbi:MAG: hypothetical protein ACW99U_04420 [Candidatus Thorarchaeota archaeon]
MTSTQEWRRRLDKLSELKDHLTSINPGLEDQADRLLRGLYDMYGKISKLDSELGSTSGVSVLKKRKIQSSIESGLGELENEFMKTVRDLGDLMRKEQKAVLEVLPQLQGIKPKEAKALVGIKFPSIAAGDMKDFEALSSYGETFSKSYTKLHQGLAREVQDTLDENKRTLETYERHVTIDRSKVTTTASVESVAGSTIPELIIVSDKLKSETTFLDGRKDEVRRMIGVSLISEVESLQASSDTAARLGLELPIDFSKQLRTLARDAAKATDLTSLISLETQLQASMLKLANMIRDKIINIKHEVTTKIVEGGIPTTADVIPEAPHLASDEEDIANLLAAYQRMVEWSGQVQVGLKDTIEEVLEDIERATEHPEDAGIKDIVAVREFLAEARKTLKKGEVDDMIKVYLRGRSMQEEHKKNITDKIRSYLSRFNELATSADRVLDYAQLSKKAPKVEELEGGIVHLLQSLTSLKEAVESGVATFRDACQQEIDAINEDLQTIKPVYAEIFMPIVVDLEEGSGRIAKMDEFAELRSEMRSIKDSILVKAKDALENLRYRLGVKIRLAGAKLMGAGVAIPKEVQEAISELNNVGVAAENVFSLPAIARKMIELYEKNITDKIIGALTGEAQELVKSFEQATTIGVDLSKEMKTLEKILKDPPDELEDAADAFDKMRALTTSDSVQKKIKERANEANSQLEEAIGIFEAQGLSDFVSRLRTLLEKVPEQLERGTTHVNEALEVCLTLATVQQEMLGVIKDIAKKDKEQHMKDLKDKSQRYSTIETVFEKHPDDFSKVIYPVSRIVELEGLLDEADMLDKAIAYFNELKELRTGWVSKAEKMDDWHKTLRMYLTGFSPAASTEDRDKFIEDAVKKIRETFSKEDISTYLSWAIRVLAETMVGSRT